MLVRSTSTDQYCNLARKNRQDGLGSFSAHQNHSIMTEPDHTAQSASGSLSDQASQGITASRAFTSVDGGKSTLIVVFKGDGKTATSQVFVRSLKTWQADLDELDGHITSLASFADKIQGEGSILDPGKFHQNQDGATLARSLDGDTWTLSRPGLRELCFTIGGVTELEEPGPVTPERGEVKFNPMDPDSEGSSLSSPPASPAPGAAPDVDMTSPEEEPYFEEDGEEASTPEEPDADFQPPESGAESEASDIEMDFVESDGAQSEGEAYISHEDTDSGSSHGHAKTAKRRQAPKQQSTNPGRGPRHKAGSDDDSDFSPTTSKAKTLARVAQSARSTSAKRTVELVEDAQSGPVTDESDAEPMSPAPQFRTVPGYGPRKPTPEETDSEKDAVGDEVSVSSEEL